jgi:hypothetical protein
MPPSAPGYPGGSIPTAIGMRFLRHDGIYQSDVGLLKNPTRAGHCLPPMPRLEPENTPGGSRSRPIVLMSSGRLFLDRVARQHCPSPLRRHAQHISIAALKGSIYHRTVTSVLTGCLTSGGKRIDVLCPYPVGSSAGILRTGVLGERGCILPASLAELSHVVQTSADIPALI